MKSDNLYRGAAVYCVLGVRHGTLQSGTLEWNKVGCSRVETRFRCWIGKEDISGGVGRELRETTLQPWRFHSR